MWQRTFVPSVVKACINGECEACVRRGGIKEDEADLTI